MTVICTSQQVVQWILLSPLWAAIIVVSVLILKYLIISMLYQCFLCTLAQIQFSLLFTYGIFSNAVILYSCHWRKHFPLSPVIYNRTQQIVGIPSSFSANTTQHCVHLTLNDDQCHGNMYSCPKYASTSRDGFTWMVENPTWAVTIHWHLSWW